MQALENIRVLELSQALAGPYCAMMLGDLGADVIKIERPGHGDQTRGWGPPFLDNESTYFLAVNRNKRGLTLDYKQPAGLEILYRLVESADVLIVNSPSLASLERNRIDPATLRALSPGLIYVCISGYGLDGPYAGRTSYDLVIQGEAGLMSLTGEPGTEPARYPIPISDITTSLYSLIGILSALLVRERTGQGQFLDMTLFESQSSWLTILASEYFATGKRPEHYGNAHPNIVPYQVFKTAEKHIAVCVGTEAIWGRFCRVLNIENSIGADPRFATNPGRNQHRGALIPQLQAILETRTVDEWLTEFQAAAIPCGPINFVDETLSHPQHRARGMFIQLEHPLLGMIKALGSPLRLSETPVTYRLPAPLLGEHTAAILAVLGYTADQVEGLRTRCVV